MVMAEIYVNCGNYEDALNELEVVLSQESFVTTNTLRFSTWVDPLKNRPRFKTLMNQYGLPQ